jgi:hypothetical protein
MVVSEEGSSAEVKEVHERNASLPMDNNPSGKLMEPRLVQPKKASCPIPVTVAGSLTEVRVVFCNKENDSDKGTSSGCPGMVLAGYNVEYSKMVVPLMSSTLKTGIAFRMTLKSRASMVPVIVRSVTVLSSMAVSAVLRFPAVTSTVLDTCALSTMKKHRNASNRYIFFMLIILI